MIAELVDGPPETTERSDLFVDPVESELQATPAVQGKRERLRGRAAPRIAPPTPARSLIREYEAKARELGIKLMPWQKIAARFLTAKRARSRSLAWLYREIAIVVARQNGKTSLLLPLILLLLEKGLRILHTAQNRELPRETFEALAAFLADPKMRAKYGVVEIRWANGQQKIRLANGGMYTLVAPRPGVRGAHVDIVLLDEVREQRSFDLIAGIRPTMKASRRPLMVYLSNAGDADSVVLNDLRRRGEAGSERLCYLEWSAAPERALDDREGWAEANPALGFTITEETLEDDLEAMPAAAFETEDLCRWVPSTSPKMIADGVFDRLRGALEAPTTPVFAASMDGNSRRAAAAIAWQQSDGRVAFRLAFDVTGDPIDTSRLGPDMATYALKAGAFRVGYDDLTDQELAKYLKATAKSLAKLAKPINGREFANACENFVRLAEGGKLVWDDADGVSADLVWTGRRPLEGGAWFASKVKEDRPIVAVLAAIRAVWLASGPRPAAAAVY